MLKTVVLLGVFFLIFSSGIVLRDWGNEEPVKLLGDDELDSDYQFINPEDYQCLFQDNKLNQYPEKEMMPTMEISNG